MKHEMNVFPVNESQIKWRSTLGMVYSPYLLCYTLCSLQTKGT